MNYSQMKEELKLIRENNNRINLLIRMIRTQYEDGLAAANEGAMDYAKERVQNSHDPDGKLISIIMSRDKKIANMEKTIIELTEKTRKTEAMLERAPGLAGEITRAYYINCRSMKYIARATNYSISKCWRFVDSTIDWMIQEVESND